MPSSGVQWAEGDGNVQIAYSPGAQVEITYGGGTPRLVPLRPAAVPVGAGVSPARLLGARSQVVPYTARLGLLDDLKGWLTGPGAFLVRLIGGRGGSGKTRVAVELATWSQVLEPKWLAGLLVADTDGGATDELIQAPGPRLVVIDYAETRLSQLSALLPRLSSHATDQHPVRVLLLVRDRPHAGRDLRALLGGDTEELDSIVDDVDPTDLSDPTLDERRGLFTAAARAFVTRDGTGLAVPDPPDDLHQTVYDRPLMVAIAAYLAVHNPTGDLPTTRDGLLEELLGHEDRHWKATAGHLNMGPTVRRRVVAIATLAGANSEVEAIAVLRLIPDLATVDSQQVGEIARWAHTLYPGPAYWNPLEPDLLGEHLVASCWSDHSDVIAATLTDRPTASLRQPLEVLARAATGRPRFATVLSDVITARLLGLCRAAIAQAATRTGYTDYFTDTTIAAALERTIRAIPPHADVMPEVLDQFPPRTDLVLTPLRLTLAAQLAHTLRATNPDHPHLPITLNNLSVFLDAVGRREEALAAAEEAVAIYRVLVEVNPAAYTPALAPSLNNLSNRLNTAGRREEALVASEEAVGVYRVLAEANPAAYTPALAMSLNNLSNHLDTGGRREEALAAIEEAVAVYRVLVEANPAAYTPDLAVSLNNRSNHLDTAGRRAEALAASEEAVTIRRVLVEANPAAYTPDLASSLNNLSNRLDTAGRREEALAASEEAVAIYRVLVEANPAAYTPALASSLNNLAKHLDGLGRNDEAGILRNESDGIFKSPITHDTPGTHIS
ncbi:MAG: repeat-containing protein [Acidimicrobiales bacterium]|nr:repeat-containing protein [Acidimicrobiales bacterium]